MSSGNWLKRLSKGNSSFYPKFYKNMMNIEYDYFICLLPWYFLKLICIWLLPRKAPSWAATRDLSGPTAHRTAENRGSRLVREQVNWEVQHTHCAPVRSVFLETLFDCSQFQNTQAEESQNHTMDWKCVCTDRSQGAFTTICGLWFLQLLIICTTLPSAALQVFVNLPTLKYWSCIFEWWITSEIPP